MQTQLKLNRVNPERLLSDYIDRRLSFVLGRFGDRIGIVTVRITNSGSPDDLTCGMSAELHAFGVVTAEAKDPDVYSAIDRCAGRLARRFESKCARPLSRRESRASVRMLGMSRI